MKKTIRLVSLLLALLLCAAIFVSCGDTNTPASTTTAAAQTEKPVDPEDTAPVFPEANYNGETFLVYAREASSYSQSGIYAEEQNGDVVNDQTLIRNQRVESKYNMKFAIRTASNPHSSLQTDLKGDTVDYDLILDQRSSMKTDITSGFLADWHTVNVDTTKSWWDANCTSGYDINGKLYYAVNDVSTANLTSARFPYFNKKMVTDYNLEDPYKLIKENKWVLDTFVSMVKSITNPIDDPNTLGTYGLLRETGESNGNNMHLMFGCGITLTKWEDGKLVSNVDGSMIEKMQDITDKLQTILNKDYTKTYDEVDAIDKSTGDSGKWDKGRRNFAEGHFLFVQNGMGVAYLFQDMQDGFGVAVNPKYDSNQDSYHHRIDKYSLIWAIPNSASVDLERLAVITDYWAYCSTDTVMQSFYEVVTKGKRAQDATAGENLDIVKSTIAYELADIFDLGLSAALQEGYESKNVAAKFTNNRAMQVKLDNVNKSLEALE